MNRVRDVEELANNILALPARSDRHARFVAISGIDASGKGHTAARLAARLEARGCRVALINIDGWLNLPSVRFAQSDPATHFYYHAFRFDEMFAKLVDPLVSAGGVRVTAYHTEETATVYRSQKYSYCDIDTVLLEGIFLFRRDLRTKYDVAIWIDCSFETALQRAIMRAQEGLSRSATVSAFERIYSPAQRLHFVLDEPRRSADFIFNNDEQTQSSTAA